MAKKKKGGNPKSQRRMLRQDQMSIVGEARYIISLAKKCDARVVTLGSLLLFSTETGDAWMLDLVDNLALCLARDGQEQPFTIKEDPRQFAIEWNAQYRIDGSVFTIIERTGQIRTILGYPTSYIAKAARQVT
jgi:hypothetical protein